MGKEKPVARTSLLNGIDSSKLQSESSSRVRDPIEEQVNNYQKDLREVSVFVLPIIGLMRECSHLPL